MRARIGVLGLSAALVAVAAAAAATTWRVAETATTATYKLSLDVGPEEAMYAQVKAQHPKTGEVMLGGSMSTGSDGHAMGMEVGTTSHLEVHVRLRSTGAVAGGLKPAITLTDETVTSMATDLPVVTMQGIGQGTSDLHYGNNVTLQPGDRYKVAVAIKGQHATFTFRAG